MTTTAAAPAETAGSSRPCNRCKDQEGTIDLRGAEIVCKTCFAYYVSSKAIKRLEALQRETSIPRAKGPRRPQRYLVGLSCGPSSTALLHVLTENVRQQRAKGQKTSRFEYVAVHVVDDTVAPYTEKGGDENQDPYIAAFRARFPDANLQTVPLSSALELPSIDWTTLPNPNSNSNSNSPKDSTTTTTSPSHRLSRILHSLPSTTSRADVRRLLTRHVLVAAAARRGCDALLLGHSTTSLAELTLSETAKGRGFALPWLVNDGAVPLPSGLDAAGFLSSDENGTTTTTTQQTSLPIYSPLRELFRKEIVTYLVQILPPGLASSLLPPAEAAKLDGSTAAAVVSHRDLSIDDVLGRYFAEVEASYPSVVANVVRTTGKLVRVSEGDDHHHDHHHNTERTTAAAASNGTERERTHCALCGASLDELGDQRWRGEIGDDEDDDEGSKGAEIRRKLCYGCQRTIRG
ncbi:hypothetical protein F4811DRAFT_533702 [Daldinia bambusicola]|nr:hypothetical protein F4811DRAFT_533702 [Daldinia bambusicola]